jgi:hypothetical protein
MSTLKETSAGGVGSLFGKGINPCLAVFQTMLHQKQLVLQLLPKQQVWQVTYRPFW